MKSVAKAGGVASLIQALCYICGFAMLATMMNPENAGDWSQVQKLEYILEHAALFQLWSVIIYVIFGVALVVLAVSLHRLLGGRKSLLVAIATPFGLIWSGLVIASGMVANVGLSAVSDIYARSAEEAAISWAIIGTVQDGIGGGVELVGGIWVLLVSVSSMISGEILPKWLNWVGFIVGAAGIATIVPALSELGAVFGLTQIIWFIGVGLVLLRVDDAQLFAAGDI
jgi:hypothetical protein